MRAVSVALACALFGTAHSVELTKETWDAAVAGKTVFVKFQAPWCGHCKRMKPDWDKLSAQFQTSDTVVIADVDCTAGGKAKCDEVGVRGYPTLKYGDPDDLQDYKGGRSFSDLKTFADGLGPQCGPGNLDLCDADKKAKIEEYSKLTPQKREEMIKEMDSQITQAEADFKKFVDGLQKSYQEANEKKDKDVEGIKNSGLGLLKSVNAYEKKQGGKEEL